MKLIFVILFVLWFFSYRRFMRELNYYRLMVKDLEQQLSLHPEYSLYLRYASALCMTQQYKDAYDVYQKVLDRFPIVPDREAIRMNMDFCKCPLPGSSLKNHKSDWIHHFLLARLGGRRQIFLTQEDYLRTNSLERNQKHSSAS